MTIKKEIIFPYFLECCTYAKDIFWQNIFEDLAYGKTPTGSYFITSKCGEKQEKALSCSYKNKKFVYKIIEEKDSKSLYSEISELLSNKLGILSKNDKTVKKKDFRQVEMGIQEERQTWKGVKKTLRSLHIENYTIEMMKKYDLNLQQSKRLLSLITIAILFKIITSDDITYDGTKITNINGIDFKKHYYNLNRVKPNDSAKPHDSEKMEDTENETNDKDEEMIDINPEGIDDFLIEDGKDKINISDYWEKYLRILEKKFK